MENSLRNGIIKLFEDLEEAYEVQISRLPREKFGMLKRTLVFWDEILDKWRKKTSNDNSAGRPEKPPENFSADTLWMAGVVLLAKNTYVWLDQLSKKYKRPISRLDHIPDEELEILADWGITGLWLIGLWERSRASQRIKQIMGNSDAIASAYSLFDYKISDELGGDEAVMNLAQRASQWGIRLASDMVPNHMGIDSRWVLEHPERFLSVDSPPYPSYTFKGPNLSSDERVGIFLEDHYYDRTDAAVVFKREDYRSGEVKYIYHGNDGTGMPWNDTAQLDFTRAETREAVFQTILQVTRQFPIVRFDAAMTLAKQHIQRLWFPKSDSEGEIPSRLEHGMTKEEFDRLVPKEFWREAVDRIAEETPDTMLLAEAFWMMEGYFVRTLGIHRAYNAAFMHMVRDEENAKYRQVIKDILGFDPRILKGFVNFMSNPDEETAAAQFGKGDKYFGVATLMATLPGLPMVGHGQIEGFEEKYGMEYKQAKKDEKRDEELVSRHKRMIFPLFKKRRLFAEADNFMLYDFYSSRWKVNENVFAYSNQSGDQQALVIYNNKQVKTRGRVKTSEVYPESSDGGGRSSILKSLAEGLGIPKDDDAYLIFRDHTSGLEHIHSCKELHKKGLYVALSPYQAYVFLDFRVVHDRKGEPYARLTSRLAGKGVPSVEGALWEFENEIVRSPFQRFLKSRMLKLKENVEND